MVRRSSPESKGRYEQVDAVHSCSRKRGARIEFQRSDRSDTVAQCPDATLIRAQESQLAYLTRRPKPGSGRSA